MTTLDTLIALAKIQKSKYPQYDGHFDNYELVRFATNFSTRMGLAFSKGEDAIARPQTQAEREEGIRTVYCHITRLDTSVFVTALELEIE